MLEQITQFLRQQTQGGGAGGAPTIGQQSGGGGQHPSQTQPLPPAPPAQAAGAGGGKYKHFPVYNSLFMDVIKWELVKGKILELNAAFPDEG